MKKIIFILLVLSSTFNYSHAQQGYKTVELLFGKNFDAGFSSKISLEFPNSSYNGFEIFMQYYNSQIEKNYFLGTGYKHTILRNLNSLFRLKFNAKIGTTKHDFILSPTFGTEYILFINPNIDFIGNVEGGYYFNSFYKWRIESYLGIRYNF